MKAGCALLLFALVLAGCGSGAPGCTPTAFSFDVEANQGTVSADHSEKAPANQQKFTAYAGALSGPGCATPAIVGPVHARWTASQPAAIQISSAPDDSNGLVTCTAATDGSATITALYSQGDITERASTGVTCR